MTWWQRRGLGPRLLFAHSLVILAGGTTLLALALTLAPGLFRDHLRQTVGPIPENLATHIGEAFSRAVVLALVVAVAAASATALAVSLLLTRRLVLPVAAMAAAARRIIAGRYDVRIESHGLGVEFEALGRSFDEMAAALAATERVRAELLRDVAHELRTPLATIRAYVEAVADGVMPPDSETTAVLEAELDRVERLVHDLDKVSRAEERHLDLHMAPEDVARIVTSATAAARPAYVAEGVRLVESVDPTTPKVLGDPDRLHEVLTNLLDNARRHARAGDVVTVSAHRRGAEVEIAVQDTGEGIPPEALPRVFERFYRADSGRSRSRGGSGIGLTIARALVAAHGGDIRAMSTGPGQGATFTVTLPVAEVRKTSAADAIGGTRDAEELQAAPHDAHGGPP
jgi:two-component system, OmpR family, sensor histidine kinase BaeS